MHRDVSNALTSCEDNCELPLLAHSGHASLAADCFVPAAEVSYRVRRLNIRFYGYAIQEQIYQMTNTGL